MATEPPRTDWFEDGQGYVLNSNRDHAHAAACRLNLQFYLWKEILKFNIHPLIPVLPNSVIADVACGTGLWLMDVARELPAAQVDGFDIDLSQGPPPGWLPPNATIRYWNIFDDLPADLVGKYDVVHVRLLVLVIEQGNPRPVLQKLLKMLKPGGCLQWDELDVSELRVKKIDPQVSTSMLEKLREISWAGGRHDWTHKLPAFMIEEGFEDEAMIESYYDPKHLIRAFNDQYLLTMDEIAAFLVKTGKREVAETLYQLIFEGYNESTAGAAVCVPKIVCVARKPESDG